jgi:hypothetical protein
MCLVCKRAWNHSRKQASTRAKDPVRVACGRLGYEALLKAGKVGQSTANRIAAARATWQRRRAAPKSKPQHRLTEAERTYRRTKCTHDREYARLMREAKREYEAWLNEPVIPRTHPKEFDCKNSKQRLYSAAA